MWGWTTDGLMLGMLRHNAVKSVEGGVKKGDCSGGGRVGKLGRDEAQGQEKYDSSRGP